MHNLVSIITSTDSTIRNRSLDVECRDLSLDQMLGRLASAGTALYLPLETKAYRVGGSTVSQRQFCVQDPDGYLLRFCEAA